MPPAGDPLFKCTRSWDTLYVYTLAEPLTGPELLATWILCLEATLPGLVPFLWGPSRERKSLFPVQSGLRVRDQTFKRAEKQLTSLKAKDIVLCH